MASKQSDADQDAATLPRTQHKLGERPWLSLPDRYEVRERLGAGSMGEVLLCHDRVLHRDVALKTMREDVTSDSNLVARFEHEVQVQGQLDHPAIVPVYDCGRSADGLAWFTMKRVQGKSLAQVIARLCKEPGSAALYGPRRILSAFATICLAVAFAHARNIVHRDIKPSNIMLGDFGEVYLLDWGVARLPNAVVGGASVELPQGASLTLAGDIVGTVGYMAPEQLRGGTIDERADVYALGAVLFEVLTLSRLNTGEAAVAAASTLGGVDARASKRVPDREIPLELEELCCEATTMRPAQRPSAMDLHNRVQAFLDGQRDLEERQRQSQTHHARAVAAYTGVRVSDTAAAAAAREETLRELSRAIALDDANSEARSLLHELVAGPRSEDDEVIIEALQTSAITMREMLSRVGVLFFVAWLLILAASTSLGVRTWSVIALMTVLAGTCAVLLRAQSRKQSGLRGWAVLLTANLAAAASATAFGAFILLPSMLCCIMVAFALGAGNPQVADRHDMLARAIPVGVVVVGGLTFLGVLGLQLAGVIFPQIDFNGDTMVFHASSVGLPPLYTPLFLTVVNLILITGLAIMVLKGGALAARIERRALAEVAHLRPLVPGSSSKVLDPPSRRR